jgi:hypothetical protein
MNLLHTVERYGIGPEFYLRHEILPSKRRTTYTTYAQTGSTVCTFYRDSDRISISPIFEKCYFLLSRDVEEILLAIKAQLQNIFNPS